MRRIWRARGARGFGNLAKRAGMTRSLWLVALVAVSAPALADEWYYATKADAKADRRTAGRPVATPQGTTPLTGGENCGTATAIAALPFSDSGDTTGHVSDVSTLPAQCAEYTQVAGPDLVYAFTVGPGNSVAFQVTPTNATYDPAIYVLGARADGSSCVIGADACVRAGFSPQPPGCLDLDADEDVPALAYAPGTHAVFVDSFYAAGATCDGEGGVQCGAGPYTLTVTGTLPVALHRFEIE
jgi:hypothetical protein